MAHSANYCDAAACPELGLDRKCPAQSQSDVIDPLETRSVVQTLTSLLLEGQEHGRTILLVIRTILLVILCDAPIRCFPPRDRGNHRRCCRRSEAGHRWPHRNFANRLDCTSGIAAAAVLRPRSHAGQPDRLLAPFENNPGVLDELKLTSWRYFRQPQKLVPRALRKLAVAGGVMVYEGPAVRSRGRSAQAVQYFELALDAKKPGH